MPLALAAVQSGQESGRPQQLGDDADVGVGHIRASVVIDVRSSVFGQALPSYVAGRLTAHSSSAERLARNWQLVRPRYDSHAGKKLAATLPTAFREGGREGSSNGQTQNPNSKKALWHRGGCFGGVMQRPAVPQRVLEAVDVGDPVIRPPVAERDRKEATEDVDVGPARPPDRLIDEPFKENTERDGGGADREREGR